MSFYIYLDYTLVSNLEICTKVWLKKEKSHNRYMCICTALLALIFPLGVSMITARH
jgi:hypothetical protein